MAIPLLETHLPMLMPFAEKLAAQYQAGTLDTWEKMDAQVMAFFTLDVMDKVEAVLPGWKKLASYSDGATLIHVSAVLTALLLCPEYQQATPAQQTLLKWIVVFHDLEKEAQYPKRDLTHGFRSAATAGRMLPRLGFPLRADPIALEGWAAMTRAAITANADQTDSVQDNRKLPDIAAGIEHLFGADTPAGLIVRAVLLHMSINVIEQWPQAAPLNDGEIRQYVDTPLFPLLRVMMVIDNDAYAMFDPPIKQLHRHETLAAFEHVAALCGIHETPVVG